MRVDDDFELSGSDQSKLESTTKAERKALELKLQKHGLDKKTNLAADKNKLKLEVLKQKMEGKGTDRDKKNNQQKEKTGTSFGTKTREQEIAASKMTAQTKPSPDKLVEQSKQEEASKKEQQKEEIQPEGTS